MTDADLTRFAALMAALDAAFGVESSQAKAQIYYDCLKDSPIEAVTRAVQQHVQTERFYPRVAQLRDLIRGKPDDVAALALQRVNETVAEPGTYESVTFEDPVTHWVLETMGGWPAWGDVTTEEAPFREQDFRRLYEIGLRRGIGWADTHRVLKGRCSLQDAVAGLADTHAPKQIGCSYLSPQRRAEIEGEKERKAIGVEERSGEDVTQ